MPRIAVTDTVRDNALTITIDGDLDLLTAPSCASKLTRSIDDRTPTCRLVVLNMRRVGFCGAVGMRMLRTFAGQCADLGLAVCILADQASVVHRIVELAGLQDVLPVVDDLDEAAATRWMT